MAHEALAAVLPVRTDDRGRQRQVVIHESLGLGRGADLDDLERGGALEHAMADARRLQRAVPGVENERLPLVLVDHAHPAVGAVDHLERHVVEWT